MKYILTLLIATSLLNSSFCQITKTSVAKISNVNFSVTADKKVVITYDLIDGKAYEKFDIVYAVYTESGNKLDAKTASGDLKDVKPGPGKKITWDIGKDIAYLDENIYVEVNATLNNPKVVPYTSKGKALLWSTVYPGAGSARIGQNSWHIAKGIAAYACIGFALKYNNDAVKSYDSYLSESDPSKRSDYLDQTVRNQNLSSYLVYGAIAIWAIDYINIAFMDNKTDKKNKKISIAPVAYPAYGYNNVGFIFKF